MHSSLISYVLLTFERLGELASSLEAAESQTRFALGHAALGHAKDLSTIHVFLGSVHAELEAMRDSLRYANDSLSETAHFLTGEDARSPVAQVASLARLEMILMAQGGPLEWESRREQAAATFRDP